MQSVLSRASVPAICSKTPFFPQQGFHLGELRRPKALVAPTAAPPRPRAFLCLMHTVASVVPRSVAPQLPPQRAAVPPQPLADRYYSNTFPSQRCQRAALFQTSLPVFHTRLPAPIV